MLAEVASDFIQLDFEVETGKKASEKIRVPVLFGNQGNVSQAFEVDGYHRENQIVLPRLFPREVLQDFPLSRKKIN